MKLIAIRDDGVKVTLVSGVSFIVAKRLLIIAAYVVPDYTILSISLKKNLMN